MAWHTLSLIFKLAVCYGLAFVLWLPVKGSFIWLVAAASEAIIRLVEHPPIITALTSRGSSITIHSYITGAAQPLTRTNFEAVHISVVATLALALAIPNHRWSRLRMGALALALVFLVTVFVCVAQVKVATETYAFTHLGLTLHTGGERALLDWMIRKSSLAIVFVAPAFLFLTAYVSARSSARQGESARTDARKKGSRSAARPAASRRTTSVLAGGGAAALLLASLPADRSAEVHVEGLRRIAELNPASPGAQLILARSLDESGHHEEALRSYQRALWLNPDLPEAHLASGNIHFRSGAAGKAAKCYEEALKLQPSNLQARHNLGTAWLDQNLFDRAARLYEEVLAADPDHAAAHRNLGAALLGLAQPCEALAHFERSVALDQTLRSDSGLNGMMQRLRFRCRDVAPAAHPWGAPDTGP